MDSSGAGFAQVTDARTLIRQVMRRWPIVLVITVTALATSLIALESRKPSYTATAKLLISPLPQWDQTFLGTRLIRDAGDARLTASTVTETLKTSSVPIEAARSMGPRWTARSIRRAVRVEAVPDTNVIEVTSRSHRPAVAFKLAVEYARAALRVRWRAIEADISRRIALAEKTGIPISSEGGEGRGVDVLNSVRESGSDPTLMYQGTTPAEREQELNPVLVVLLALGGGLFLGSLAAVLIDRLGNRDKKADRGLLQESSDTDALSPVS
jgi:uncharacterized protein involved in exopolysaccharide biosynthesis